ncbi:uncharacterized protein LOC127851548 isoform X2 [Dreissena polymorpha]|uniref:Uncharacterized protein n=1 Tax=Dreissena polymorpha TaxID=45954 RepID=A0A9D4DB92_DREPO|nr:uncharacterized protein LOC127851548 isoform X2 [Dreissena polymorpha]KAH3741725.1 hypothetical protein DPMN_048450 [Dreissena polymorpha]
MFAGVVTGDIQSLLETTNNLSRVTTRQQSEDSINKQLAAFERLLQHSMSRFSNERLYHLLRQVTRWADAKENVDKSKNTTKAAFKLRSVHQLKEIVGTMKKENKSALNHSEENIFKTFELFVNDLLYIKDMKKYFDDEIFRSLMRYHFDASKTEPFDDNEKASPKPEDTDSGNGSMVDTDRSTGRNSMTIRGKKPQLKIKSSSSGKNAAESSKDKYKATVDELKSILHKWEGLLTEHDLDLNVFDPDSYHELMQFSYYLPFEPILRLVPDMFAKCYKCIELAKTWLKLSNVVLKDVPLDAAELERSIEEEQDVTPDGWNDDVNTDSAKTEEEFWEEVKRVQGQIESVTKSITDDEDLLEKYNEEMDVLSGREERFSSVTSQVEKIDSLITLAAGEYQKAKIEQNAMANKMKNVQKGSSTYSEMKSKLRRLDSTVAENHWKVKRLEFERTLVREDFVVELDVRPSFILFMGDTKEKITDLKRFLEVKREEKIKLEKQLALMKTNTERMREIMRSYLGSASSNLTEKSVSRESSLSSSRSEQEFVHPPNKDRIEAGGELGGRFETIETVRSDSKQDGKRTPHTHDKNVKSPGPLVKKPQLQKRDLRPASEKHPGDVPKTGMSPTGRVVRVDPKPALKSTPRRVWENV